MRNHHLMRKHSLHRRILHLRDVDDDLCDDLYGVLCCGPYGVLCFGPYDVLYDVPYGVLCDGPYGALCDVAIEILDTKVMRLPLRIREIFLFVAITVELTFFTSVFSTSVFSAAVFSTIAMVTLVMVTLVMALMASFKIYNS